MKIFWMILFGFLSGIVGGMGMGGGTVLVPLMSFLNLSQKSVQATNLISFLPMCLVALCFHAKNHLIEKQHVGWLIVPALLLSVVGAFFAGKVDDKILKICFGVFLVGVGVWQIIVAINYCIKQRKKHNSNTQQ